MARCRNEVFYVRQGHGCKRSHPCLFKPFFVLFATAVFSEVSLMLTIPAAL